MPLNKRITPIDIKIVPFANYPGGTLFTTPVFFTQFITPNNPALFFVQDVVDAGITSFTIRLRTMESQIPGFFTTSTTVIFPGAIGQTNVIFVAPPWHNIFVELEVGGVGAANVAATLQLF